VRHSLARLAQVIARWAGRLADRLEPGPGAETADPDPEGSRIVEGRIPIDPLTGRPAPPRGPPADWVARVREVAPELLEPRERGGADTRRSTRIRTSPSERPADAGEPPAGPTDAHPVGADAHPDGAEEGRRAHRDASSKSDAGSGEPPASHRRGWGDAVRPAAPQDRRGSGESRSGTRRSAPHGPAADRGAGSPPPFVDAGGGTSHTARKPASRGPTRHDSATDPGSKAGPRRTQGDALEGASHRRDRDPGPGTSDREASRAGGGFPSDRHGADVPERSTPARAPRTRPSRPPRSAPPRAPGRAGPPEYRDVRTGAVPRPLADAAAGAAAWAPGQEPLEARDRIGGHAPPGGRGLPPREPRSAPSREAEPLSGATAPLLHPWPSLPEDHLSERPPGVETEPAEEERLRRVRREHLGGPWNE
jgi:hypothetical protein